jgi:hypothetical protein
MFDEKQYKETVEVLLAYIIIGGALNVLNYTS